MGVNISHKIRNEDVLNICEIQSPQDEPESGADHDMDHVNRIIDNRLAKIAKNGN